MGSEFDRGIDVTASNPGEYVAELDAHVRADPAPGWLARMPR